MPQLFNDIEVTLFNDTATTEIYTLSLHDALPIYQGSPEEASPNYVCCTHYHYCSGAPPL